MCKQLRISYFVKQQKPDFVQLIPVLSEKGMEAWVMEMKCTLIVGLWKILLCNLKLGSAKRNRDNELLLKIIIALESAFVPSGGEVSSSDINMMIPILRVKLNLLKLRRSFLNFIPKYRWCIMMQRLTISISALVITAARLICEIFYHWKRN